ncbi:glycosyltransferase family 4 protein [Paenibacillus herberti]|nr:glycosyltransferase family 4 protein [Paenibacillus herberti]
MARKLKLAIVAFELPSTKERTGGVSHFNHRLCNMLVEKGHEVTVYSVREAVPDAQYEVKLVPGAIGTGRFHRYYKAPWTSKCIDFAPYDLVVSSGDDWAMKRGSVPWIRIMHGSARRELQFNKRMLRKLNLSFLYVLEVLSTLRSDITLFNSNDTRRLYPNRQLDRIEHLPVDTRVFYPGPKNQQPTLMFVGALDSRKRGGWLKELFTQQIKPAVPDAKLIMVCNAGEPADGIEYIDMPSQLELAELYRSSHVFCMPSTYEGFGIPYLEAMASGTLVVTTPNPGAIEVLGNGKYGRLVNDVELGQALIKALTNLGNHGNETEPALEWAKSHDWSEMIENYIRYREVVKPDQLLSNGGKA